jgi:hypothetical protein
MIWQPTKQALLGVSLIQSLAIQKHAWYLHELVLFSIADDDVRIRKKI